MKLIQIVISLIFVITLGYLISCDITDSKKIHNSYSFTDVLEECYTDPDRCFISSNCNSGKGMHFCLFITFGDTDEEFDYEAIYKVAVTQIVTDCNNNTYYCNYVAEGTNAQVLGCVLPWCNDNCSCVRSICLATTDGKIYTGSKFFQYTGFDTSDAFVPVYLNNEVACDFGGVEKNNEY